MTLRGCWLSAKQPGRRYPRASPVRDTMKRGERGKTLCLYTVERRADLWRAHPQFFPRTLA